MKSFFLIAVIMAMLSTTIEAQNRTVEKSIFGVQLGIIELDFYNEARLADKVALRSEISLYSGIWGGTWYPSTGYVIFPTIMLQPKYYYNIEKRAINGKNTKNNSANYFGLKIRFTPDLFVISNYDDVFMYNQIQFVPTYGIRRNFGKKFNYEFNAGLGYGTTMGYDYNTAGAVLDIGIKIGYDF